MQPVGRGDSIYLLNLFFIILIFNIFVFIVFLYNFFQNILFHNIQGSKLKLQLKNEKEVL